jgi:hypothetical protein
VSMNRALIPDWVKDIKTSDDEEKAGAEAREQRELAASFTVASGKPEYLRQFKIHLKHTIDSLEAIGLRASIFFSGDETKGEATCRIDVARMGAFPAMTYLNLYFSHVTSTVRCWPMKGEAFALSFHVRPDNPTEVCLVSESLTMMNPETAARSLVEPLVKQVRGR